MAAAVGYLHSEELRDDIFYTLLVHIAVILIQSLISTLKWWQRWDIFILRKLRDGIFFFNIYNTTIVHNCNIDTKLNQHYKNGGSGGIPSFCGK